MKPNTPHTLSTISTCLSLLTKKGFTAPFVATHDGLMDMRSSRIYQPHELEIINFYRFEGASNPEDNVILYAIKTSDDCKGTLIDIYGAQSDPAVAQLITQIEHIHKES